MSAVVTSGPDVEREISINDSICRVWEKGKGVPTVLFSGLGGIPRWTEFHEAVAEDRRLIVVSLPGQHGSERGQEKLNNQLDWLAMSLDVIDEVSGGEPVDLVACSIAAMLAGEVAASSRASVKRLILIGAFGLYDEAAPPVNIFAQTPLERPGFLMENSERYKEVFAVAEDAEEADGDEWLVTAYRADETLARLFWPVGDFKLVRRLHRITAPTLIVWGENDRLVAPSYAERFAAGIAGETRVEIVPGAGHLVHVDESAQVAALVSEFLGSDE